MTTKQWTPTDISNAKTIGYGMSVLEFQDNKGEWHVFEVLKTPARLVFGGSTNTGFLESGYIERSEWESLNDTVRELLSDLETYYNDGPQYVSRIVVNERM